MEISFQFVNNYFAEISMCYSVKIPECAYCLSVKINAGIEMTALSVRRLHHLAKKKCKYFNTKLVTGLSNASYIALRWSAFI